MPQKTPNLSSHSFFPHRCKLNVVWIIFAILPLMYIIIMKTDGMKTGIFVFNINKFKLTDLQSCWQQGHQLSYILLLFALREQI